MMPARTTGTFRLTADDMVDAAQLFARSSLFRPRVAISFGVLWIIVVVLLVSFADGARNLALTMGASLLPFAFIIVLSLVMTPIVARRNYARQRSLRGDLVLSWSETGLHTVSEYGTFEIPWSHFVRHAENDRLFMLFESDRLYRPIPKRLLSEEQQADFRGWIQAIGR